MTVLRCLGQQFSLHTLILHAHRTFQKGFMNKPIVPKKSAGKLLSDHNLILITVRRIPKIREITTKTLIADLTEAAG